MRSSAGYLARAGYKVIMLERRHTVGGGGDRRSCRASSSTWAARPTSHPPHAGGPDLNLAAYRLEYIGDRPALLGPVPRQWLAHHHLAGPGAHV
ncbi:MAG: hypothetical protein R2838_26665 [Caldilineaceae bacterium]